MPVPRFWIACCAHARAASTEETEADRKRLLRELGRFKRAVSNLISRKKIDENLHRAGHVGPGTPATTLLRDGGGRDQEAAGVLEGQQEEGHHPGQQHKQEGPHAAPRWDERGTLWLKLKERTVIFLFHSFPFSKQKGF
jgi:hypothetical protein